MNAQRLIPPPMRPVLLLLVLLAWGAHCSAANGKKTEDSARARAKYESLLHTLTFREVNWKELNYPAAFRDWEKLAREHDPEGKGIPLIQPPDSYAWVKEPEWF